MSQNIILEAKTVKKIERVLLTQPNYSWFDGRGWKLFPYGMAVLNGNLKDSFRTEILDSTFHNLSEEQVEEHLMRFKPDAVCVGSISMESHKVVQHITSLIKKTLPGCIVVVGGALPTTALSIAMKDKNTDYWVMGEGEFRIRNLLLELNKPNPDLTSIDGLAYYKDGAPQIIPSKGFVQDLDSVPFADYGNLNFSEYSNNLLKYSLQFVPRQFPYSSYIKRLCLQM